MADPHPLLALQRIDSARDALRREREAVPERAKLAAARAGLARIASERETARERLVLLGRELRRIEGELGQVRDEAGSAETRLYAGTVKAHSELSDLQAKLRSLREQQARFEDEALAVMEQQETVEAAVAGLDREAAELEQQCVALGESLAAEEKRIDGLLAGVGQERAAHLPSLAAGTLAIYERLRGSPRLGGLVAVPLEKDCCSACRTAPPVMHLTRIRSASPDDPVRCQRCQRLLVR